MSEEDLSQMQKDLRQVRIVTSGICVAVLCALVWFNVEILLWVPNAERFYEDMLGSKGKLPELTKTILGLYHAMGMVPMMGLIAISGALAGFLAVRRSNNLMSLRFAVILMIGLTLLWLVLDCGVKSPIVQIIQNMVEKA